MFRTPPRTPRSLTTSGSRETTSGAHTTENSTENRSHTRSQRSALCDGLPSRTRRARTRSASVSHSPGNSPEQVISARRVIVNSDLVNVNMHRVAGDDNAEQIQQQNANGLNGLNLEDANQQNPALGANNANNANNLNAENGENELRANGANNANGINGFLRECEVSFDAANTEMHTLVRLASRALKDDAARWFAVYKNLNISWAKFCELLRSRYASPTTLMRLSAKL